MRDAGTQPPDQAFQIQHAASESRRAVRIPLSRPERRRLLPPMNRADVAQGRKDPSAQQPRAMLVLVSSRTDRSVPAREPSARLDTSSRLRCAERSRIKHPSDRTVFSPSCGPPRRVGSRKETRTAPRRLADPTYDPRTVGGERRGASCSSSFSPARRAGARVPAVREPRRRPATRPPTFQFRILGGRRRKQDLGRPDARELGGQRSGKIGPRHSKTAHSPVVRSAYERPTRSPSRSRRRRSCSKRIELRRLQHRAGRYDAVTSRLTSPWPWPGPPLIADRRPMPCLTRRASTWKAREKAGRTSESGHPCRKGGT